MKRTNYSGKIVKRVYGTGSKSHHDAILLVTQDGEYKLRRAGGNPFKDTVLEKLVGMSVECIGTEIGSTLVIESWDELRVAARTEKKKSTKKKSTKKKSTKKKSTKKKSTKKKSTKKKSTKKKSTKKKSGRGKF